MGYVSIDNLARRHLGQYLRLRKKGGATKKAHARCFGLASQSSIRGDCSWGSSNIRVEIRDQLIL